ncbi:HNH endonuclease [Spirulina sp. CCNP1310]|uniref:HNH endonuclease n=1 Tax=Spirulina sp. CCNP1310 TaxID=3110249 RepID=UPI002B202835|nr:HNH endonuclease [Spirulina sp. CCNP1310]MEA5421081.1 HNH endonuclease [Spirulina sp. CCNP1310]
MSVPIPDPLRQQIAKRDGDRCCYCLTTAVNSGVAMTCDHIQPISKGGSTTSENLCLACSACNLFKSYSTEALDVVSGETAPLFNPIKQSWSDHFVWSADKTQVEGITPTGRVTVNTLRMNRIIIVLARQRWVSVGWHPPQ